MGAPDFSKLPHIGEAIRRKEDYRFLTGAGNYTDDITMGNQAHCVFVRSPHAHATVKSVDIADAMKMPGVVGIFSGKDIDGRRLSSTFTLTHAIPDGAVITSPEDGATLPANGVTVEWQPVTTPAGIDIVAYQVLVVADDSGLGTAERTVDVTLPATATRMAVPPGFLTPGGYKTEVLAIERSGNQTLAEIAFRVVQV